MSKAEYKANKMLQARGYLVVESDKLLRRGEVLKELYCHEGTLKHPVSVIGPTDRSDFVKQVRLAGGEPLPQMDYHHYYRVTAE